MKIICTDNFDRDYISDRLVVEHLTEYYAKLICKLLNDNDEPTFPNFYRSVEDDYELYKFKP